MNDKTDVDTIEIKMIAENSSAFVDELIQAVAARFPNITTVIVPQPRVQVNTLDKDENIIHDADIVRDVTELYNQKYLQSLVFMQTADMVHSVPPIDNQLANGKIVVVTNRGVPRFVIVPVGYVGLGDQGD